MKFIFAGLGIFFVACAVLGIFLPLVPTVPFLLMAAFFFARSSSRLHAWILGHRTFGPMIIDWQQHGAIRPGAKKAATFSVAAVFIFSIVIGLSTHILVIQGITLSAVLLFIWSRPNG